MAATAHSWWRITGQYLAPLMRKKLQIPTPSCIPVASSQFISESYTHCCLCRSSGLLCSTCVKNPFFFFFFANGEAQVITAPSSVYHMRLTWQVCGRMRLLRRNAVFTGCPKRQKVFRAASATAVIVQFRMLFDFLSASIHKAGSPNALAFTLCFMSLVSLTKVTQSVHCLLLKGLHTFRRHVAPPCFSSISHCLPRNQALNWLN